MIYTQKPKHNHDRDARYEQFNYDVSAPFFNNPRGKLCHRVHSLYRLSCNFRSGPWWIVEYWCENYGSTRNENAGLKFDPGERLICTRCEANATAKGEKTSSELAGRHVCTGVVRPVNTCCNKKRDSQ